MSASEPPTLLQGLGRRGLGAQAVAVAEEQDVLAGALSRLAGLNPLAHASASPHGSDETKEAILGIGAVVLAHDGSNGIRGLVGIVKGNGADVVVQDMSLDNSVQQVTTDEAHLAINGGSGATDKVPLVTRVVRQGGIGVLEEGDGDYITS